VVHAVETNLQRLLEGTKQYQVPLYQRTYSWKNEQLQRLWDDLVKLAADRHLWGSSATHFIGSLVLAPSPAIGPAGLLEFLVVDGQQRLTTLTLLLTAIRDHRADTEHPSHLERVNDKYLVNKWEEGQPTKLLPTQADRGSYFACIHRTSLAGGSDPVGAAYRFFRTRLAELDDPDDDLDIQRLEDAVISGLSLVCVTAQAGDNVHRIFESLNNTGLRLTQGDLIRNYLFMRLPTRAEHVYRSVWLPLQERLTSDQLEMLFWLDLVQFDETAKQTDTYALQQARLDRLHEEAEIEDEVGRFARIGHLLTLILDPSKEPDADVRRGLDRLGRWGTTTVYPVLLHLLERRQRGEIGSADLADAMRCLESFFVRRVIAGKATKNLNRILLRAVQEIRGQDSSSSALRDYLSGGRRDFASDGEIRTAVRTIAFYWSGKAAQKNLILQWLEESSSGKEQANVSGLTIEHVLPQSPTDDWRAAIAVDLEPGEDLDSVYQSVVHTLGNLTLTGYNSELSNSPFAVKRGHLDKSPLRMNRDIAANDQWGRKEIWARADEMAERIIGQWPGPNPRSEEVAASALWTAVAQVLAEIPAGAWTTYGDVAAVVGTHPVPLGQRLANHPVANAHRVLGVGGVVASNFRWGEEQRTESAQAVLESEGVRFGADGRADASQRLSAEDLAILSGVLTEGDNQPVTEELGGYDRRGRFFEQLSQRHSEAVQTGLSLVMDAWTHLGGHVSFGNGAETSCFLSTGLAGDRLPWPFTIYPSGKVEVVFQFMASRPPFDDVTLRHEFRERLNQVPGVSLSPARIELRPGFPPELLGDAEARDLVIAHLAWFIDQVREARTPAGD
jgi:alkylated DNA nucleotide flippase Atl1